MSTDSGHRAEAGLENLGNAPLQKEASDVIIGYLEQLGVEFIFGIPGGAIEPLYNTLARSSRRGEVRPALARHASSVYPHEPENPYFSFCCDEYHRHVDRHVRMLCYISVRQLLKPQHGGVR
ncbi:MAG: thiamine pyrophosphate-binding protein [Pseudomonadota bacterium]